MRLSCIVAYLALATPSVALDLSLPGGSLVQQVETPAGSVRMPRNSWTEGLVYPGVDGAVRRSVYTILNPALTTLQLVEPVRQTLAADGYEEVFACADRACGGFDFRFQLDLIPAPDMYVDLGDYRYLLMEKPGASPHSVALVASSSTTSGFLHVTEVGDAYLPEVTSNVRVDPRPAETSLEDPELVQKLIERGHAVLTDLEFATGSSDLGAGPFRSLQTIADWLEETPGAQIVLVGHTDSVGSLEANTSLSRRRALSVQNRLTSVLGANPSQVAADGAGALSPIASNLSAEGRAQNRRVEVVLLSNE